MPVEFAAAPLPTGPSFLAGQSARDQVRSTLCLATAIYYEAATEPDEGQRAVAQVVLNRVRHSAWPNTVCGVVYQGSDREGCQFSFACDGAMGRAPSLAYWSRARRVAEAALAGAVYEPVGSATFYHTPAVAPAWRLRLIPVATVGGHIFYRQPQDAPDAALLPVNYAGREPNPGPLPRIIPPAQLAALTLPPLTTLQVAPVVPDATMIAPTANVPTKTPPPSTRKAVAQDNRYVPGALPESDVLPQYRSSGEIIAR
jgi:Cell Wall Hydrolase